MLRINKALARLLLLVTVLVVAFTAPPLTKVASADRLCGHPTAGVCGLTPACAALGGCPLQASRACRPRGGACHCVCEPGPI